MRNVLDNLLVVGQPNNVWKILCFIYWRIKLLRSPV